MANAKHCLIVEIPGESARHYLLSASKITIGRTAKNGIVLEVDTVSGSHLEMKRKGSGYEVVDLGSTNGTRVNGKEVQKEPRELRDGDVIKVGLDVQARLGGLGKRGPVFHVVVQRHRAEERDDSDRRS